LKAARKMEVGGEESENQGTEVQSVAKSPGGKKTLNGNRGWTSKEGVERVQGGDSKRIMCVRSVEKGRASGL